LIVWCGFESRAGHVIDPQIGYPAVGGTAVYVLIWRRVAEMYAKALAPHQGALGLVDPDADPRLYGMLLKDIGGVHARGGRLADSVCFNEAATRYKRAEVSQSSARGAVPGSAEKRRQCGRTSSIPRLSELVAP
jgi:hypothetical protein